MRSARGSDGRAAGDGFEPWPLVAGVLQLPDGRRVRGRGLRRPAPGGPDPDHGYYLTGLPPPPLGWDSRWVPWPDFLLPLGWRRAARALVLAHQQAAHSRVELACHAGRGRTGTALACMSTLGGLTAREAIGYVRTHYDRHAVDTPWQRGFVRWFARRARTLEN
ncbi:protein phosphatase [Georgenia sp. SYP-B2076]|uniref:protein-tyrosine phosphatase family protein n=1 Tax=Georgenia sp. SYP-B2076 TaxID=2495881 RepID=UPI001F0C4F5A|nr:protein phosphatase [Georgenia sp. SYP-B2076]